MTYHAPELLLVGAAQNLVLGQDQKSPSFPNSDPGGILYTDIDAPDAGNW